ncbi:MAG: hypothetical protein K6G75_10520 [Lachnospiraceae bacterium]|nr:hypothetical protein [Lachnospiraceae bacterium]
MNKCIVNYETTSLFEPSVFAGVFLMQIKKLTNGRKFVNELIDFGDSLGNFANKGTQAKWTNDTSVKEMYYKDYTFIYEINSDSVIIHEIHNFAKMIRHFNK